MNKIRDSFRKLISDSYGRTQLAVFLLVLVLNILTVPAMDDFRYMIHYGFFDIFRREYIQYMTWTGRTTAHLLARSFLAMPKVIFNIANSWCFVRLCTLIHFHVKGNDQDRNHILLLLIVLTVFLFAPLFGQTCLWETGSCNYLWTTMIVLTFLKQYRFAESSAKKNHSAALIFLAGIPAGWTNENTGGALILLVMYFTYLMYRRKELKNWMLTGLAGAVIGFVMMVKAPGNSIRAMDFVSTNGKAYELIHDFYGALEVMQDGQTVLWLALAAGIALCILLKKKTNLLHSVAYAAAGAAAVCAIILSPVPVLYDRSMFGATILLMIAVLMCADQLLDDDFCRKALHGILSMMIAFSAFNYIRAVADLTYTRYQNGTRESYVSAQKAAGNLNPVLPITYDEFMTTYNAMFGLGDISESRHLWVNECFAESHGLESVQATALERWNRIYRSGDPELMNIIDFETYLNAAVQGNRVLLINSNGIDADDYSGYLTVLGRYGLHPIVWNGNTFLCAVMEDGNITDQAISSEPTDLDGNIGEAYYYLSSQQDETYSDIVVNGIEYTNDNPGITIAVYDKDSGRITDSVTWNTESDQGGVRYYIEK